MIGYTDNRASQAELVLIEAENATRRPSNVPWEAAGGVGSIAVQLAARPGATVIGLGREANHDWRLRGAGAGARRGSSSGGIP